MGLFSFMCSGCGKSIKTYETTGDPAKLFLLKDGEVIEQMEGQYDGYGRVFGSLWEMPWEDVSDLMFRQDRGNGIAAFHLGCCRAVPKERSYDDPDQGRGG